MKREVIRAALAVVALCACACAMAQDDADRTALDLNVPADPIHFVSTNPEGNPRNDPPGAWTPITVAEAQAQADSDWQVHGAVEAGIGYSKRAGNSNWQAATINLGKTTTDDDGDTRQFNININVSQGKGALFGPESFYGPGYYGPAPAPGPFRGRGPIVR